MSFGFDYFDDLDLKVVGIGVTAFMRVLPAYFIKDYLIACYKNTQDIAVISKKCRVILIERDFGKKIEKLSNVDILKQSDLQKYLSSLGKNLGIIVYRSLSEIEDICRQRHWKLLANPTKIRDFFENKKTFREILSRIGIKPIEGEVLDLKEFNKNIFLRMQKKYGQELVLKLVGVKRGGGSGNVFVDGVDDLGRFWQKVEDLKKKQDLQYLIVERKIKGISPSILGCVTHKGILTGVLQTQITDIPEVVNVRLGSGMFVGHDWSYCHYSEEIQKQARETALKFGREMRDRGFKGIFGIDFLIESGTNRVYPCECNPRYTGAFPVYPMAQIKQKEIPFDVFHLLEFLCSKYDFNFNEIQNLYWQKIEGAHLNLHNRINGWAKVAGDIKVGVYLLDGQKIKFLRSGFSMLDIKNEEEFVLTDGVPFRGEAIRPNFQVLKIIFSTRILTSDGRSLNQRTKRIVELVYQKLDLKPVSPSPEKMTGEMEF